jgi:penicillin-insensitive murein endopeptidase
MRAGIEVPRARQNHIAAWVLAFMVAAGSAAAQDKGTVDPKPLPPLANPSDPSTPAKQLFGRKTTAAPVAVITHTTHPPTPAATTASLAPKLASASTTTTVHSRTVGFYAKGCLAGGAALPINGPTWQVMRLSRNRNWGHPEMVNFLERLSERGAKVGWRGLLVGDMSQPRGGPMITGHASHQVGLDADIWFSPMPDRELTRLEREEMSATMMVAADRKDVDPAVWTPGAHNIVKAAAEDPRVERIFVNPAIKKALCRETTGDRTWLSKVRPYWGHDYHFHVRIKCPADSPECKKQDPPSASEGCSGKDLDWWFTDAVLHPKPVAESAAPRSFMKLADLPPACRQVLNAP